MIGLDTNVLARYYIQDVGDAEAEKQRDAARRLIESGQPLKVCKNSLVGIGVGDAQLLWLFGR
ncbi:MAG: hypothetical protein IPK63_16575 [Candidatus Competibacteraceae bacterium]|nr:hypothetical protein [Candidatus Competibacteraceae bacterium]